MVRLISIIQVYFLLKQSQGVSDEEMSHMLGQEMIDACKDRARVLTAKGRAPVPPSTQPEGRETEAPGQRLACSAFSPRLGLSPTGTGEEPAILLLHTPCLLGTGVDLDTELQSRFLLLKVKIVSQEFGTWKL